MKNSMFKKIGVISCSVLMLAGLASCGGETSSTPSPTTPTPTVGKVFVRTRDRQGKIIANYEIESGSKISELKYSDNVSLKDKMDEDAKKWDKIFTFDTWYKDAEFKTPVVYTDVIKAVEGQAVTVVDFFGKFNFKIDETPWHLVGTINGWDPSKTEGLMLTRDASQTQTNLFSIVYEFEANAEFQILPLTNGWDGQLNANFVTYTSDKGSIVLEKGANIKVAEAGKYTIYLDSATSNISIIKGEAKSLWHAVGDFSTAEGDGKGWNPGNGFASMDVVEPGKYTIEMQLVKGKNFRFINGAAWGDLNCGGQYLDDASKALFTVGDPGDYNMAAKEDGTYTFTLTQVNKELTLKAVKKA